MVIDMLAQPIGAQHETAGPERPAHAAVSIAARPLAVSANMVRDRIAHSGRGIASDRRAVIVAAPLNRKPHQLLLIAGWDR